MFAIEIVLESRGLEELILCCLAEALFVAVCVLLQQSETFIVVCDIEMRFIINKLFIVSKQILNGHVLINYRRIFALFNFNFEFIFTVENAIRCIKQLLQ